MAAPNSGVRPANRVLDDRGTGYGMIQPGAHPEFDQTPRKPTGVGVDVTHPEPHVRVGTPNGAPGTPGWAETEKAVQAKRAIVQGARAMRRAGG